MGRATVLVQCSHTCCLTSHTGVDFVEFDVQVGSWHHEPIPYFMTSDAVLTLSHPIFAQVTRDNHAVLWHDNTVVQQQHLEQGMPVVETAVKDMTLDAFRRVVGSAAPSARLVRHFRGAASRSPLPQEVLPW